MQRLGGLLLMLAGVSLGAYTFLPPPIDGKEALREMTRISAAPDRARPSDEVVAAAAATANLTVVAKAGTAASARPAGTASISKPASTWSAIVTAETAAQGHMRSLKPGDDGARAQLTRDLQTELKRVGCYGGDVTGNWTPSTKRAMGSFMDRVNATLPMDEPDYILLTLVQGHAEIACGGGCPAGQAIADNGRCVPNAVLARDARKSQLEEVANVEDPRKADGTRVADEQQKSAERQKFADARRDQERLRLKKADDERRAAATMASATYKPAGETGAISNTSSTQQSNQVLAQSGQERLPWLNDDLSLPAPSSAAARVARPDGIMSIGGPRLAKAEITDSAASVTPEAGPTPVAAVPDSDRHSASGRGWNEVWSGCNSRPSGNQIGCGRARSSRLQVGGRRLRQVQALPVGFCRAQQWGRDLLRLQARRPQSRLIRCGTALPKSAQSRSRIWRLRISSRSACSHGRAQTPIAC